MSKTLLSTPLHALVTATVLILLAGCGAPADSRQGNDQAKSDEACRNNPLVKALPPRTAINDLPFERWECTFDTASASYGIEGGKQVDIMLTDTRSPDIDKQPAAAHDIYMRTAGTTRQMTKFNVQTSIATRKAMETQPATLAMIGGPDNLPVIENSPTGDPLVIDGRGAVKDDPGPPGAQALLKDRYVLSIQASDKTGSFNNQFGPRAQALYDPFLKQMHLDLLP